jgi:hypothetical protein
MTNSLQATVAGEVLENRGSRVVRVRAWPRPIGETGHPLVLIWLGPVLGSRLPRDAEDYFSQTALLQAALVAYLLMDRQRRWSFVLEGS